MTRPIIIGGSRLKKVFLTSWPLHQRRTSSSLEQDKMAELRVQVCE